MQGGVLAIMENLEFLYSAAMVVQKVYLVQQVTGAPLVAGEVVLLAIRQVLQVPVVVVE